MEESRLLQHAYKISVTNGSDEELKQLAENFLSRIKFW